MNTQPSTPTDSFDGLRARMIEQQVRPSNVLDERVLQSMMGVAREKFVPERFSALAYSETRIPLECHQEMIPPSLVGRFLQALDIKPRHRILEIGTGSGYISACLSLLGKKVTSIEYHEPLYNNACANLEAYRNVELLHGNALEAKLPTVDIVIVNASCAAPPERLLHAIGPEGRGLFTIGNLDEPIMAATIVEMKAGNPFHRKELETWLPPLITN